MSYIISKDIKGLIFDFDGTVADSMPAHLLSWCEAFEKHHVKFDEDLFYEKAGVSLPGVVDFYNKKHSTDLDPYKVANLKNELHVKYIPEVKIIEPVFEVIKEYYQKIPMVIGTGNSKNTTKMAIEALNLEKYFEGVISADDVKNPKPAPDTFLAAANLIEIAPEFCEVFEDGEPGLAAAKAAGMKATDIRDWLK